MILTNYHSHCSYCDGRAPLEDFIQEAVRQGFTSYGVSSHAPLPFPTRWTMEWDRVPAYLEECAHLKDKYRESLQFYVGMEIDYLNDQSNPAASRYRDLPLDYRIGSVHLLYDNKGEIVDIDCSADKYSALIHKHFGGDIEYVVRLYYERLLTMIDLGGFDIVGHADKMHYNASAFYPGLLDETWYNDIMSEYFRTIAEKKYMVEINTKAYHQLGTFFPNERYFRLLRELGIQVMVNSDAHFPERINDGRPEALQALKNAGFTTVMQLNHGKWESIAMGL